jgi:4-alpha-glucanotransferase
VRFPRASGVLLHPTSLPGPYGIGDLGPAAYAFADALAAAKQTYWQVLPLGPTGYGDSPYQCFSAFAGNTNLISPELLRRDGWLTDNDLASVPEFPAGRVDFGAVIEYKNRLLQKAAARYRAGRGEGVAVAFDEFCHRTQGWLSDYALFRALKETHGGTSWTEWKPELVKRDATALNRAREALEEEIEAHQLYQFFFFQQWQELKEHCHAYGLRIVGDAPIFVAHDSADVWAAPTQFKLNPDGSPQVVAGVPPDYFSKTGQLWGNPIYDWERMRADGFRWWIHRMRWAFETYDLVRLDHFRGFEAAWEVPSGEETAVNGSWVTVPGEALLQALSQALGEPPIIAEDLGVITPEVEALRDRFGFPGMRVLQFAFGSDAANPHLPHNYVHNSVAYTSTHDNDTTVGWFEEGKQAAETDGVVRDDIKYALRYLDTLGIEINWDFVRAVWASVADTAIAPLQDLLGLGREGRMNLPASESGNWNWRFQEGELTDDVLERLTDLTECYGRTVAATLEK